MTQTAYASTQRICTRCLGEAQILPEHYETLNAVSATCLSCSGEHHLTYPIKLVCKALPIDQLSMLIGNTTYKTRYKNKIYVQLKHKADEAREVFLRAQGGLQLMRDALPKPKVKVIPRTKRKGVKKQKPLPEDELFNGLNEAQKQELKKMMEDMKNANR